MIIYGFDVHNDIVFAQYTAQRLKELVPHLNRTDVHILDFGCGNGHVTNYVREVFYEATIIGVDSSLEALTQARHHYPHIEFAHHESLEKMPAGTFDLIYAVNVMHHIPVHERAQTIKLLMRLLKPHGIFIIFELNPFNPITRHLFKTNPLETGLTMISPLAARTLLKPYGRVTTHYYNFFPGMWDFLAYLEPWLSKISIGGLYAVVLNT